MVWLYVSVGLCVLRTGEYNNSLSLVETLQVLLLTPIVRRLAAFSQGQRHRNGLQLSQTIGLQHTHTQARTHTHAHTHTHVREFQKKTTHDRTMNTNNKGKKKQHAKVEEVGSVNRLAVLAEEQEGLIKRGPKRNV